MRVRAEHQQMLLDICEQHPELLTNKFNSPDGKTRGHALWQNAAQKLNSLGFGEKSKDEWRKALVDWKSKTKSKAAKINLEIQKTGGGPVNYTPLTDLEKRLVGLIGKKSVEGDGVPEMGFGKVTINPVEIKDDEIPTESDHDYTDFVIEDSDSLEDIPIPGTSNASVGTLISLENIPGTSNASVPGTSTRTPIRKARKRLYTHVSTTSRRNRERVSKKLLELSGSTAKDLKEIKENTKSMAESLKIMADLMQKHYKE